MLWAAALRWTLTRRGSAIVACTVAAGLALRLASAWLVNSVPPANDPLSYSTLALSLLEGRGLLAWGLRAHYPPLYPILLAAVAWLAGSIPVAALAINVVADGCGALLLRQIARRSLSDRAATGAAAIYFMWPGLLVDGGVVQKESLCLALALGAMLAALRMFEADRWVLQAVVSGVAWGLLGLCQPALVTLPFVVIVALSVRQGEWRKPLRMLGLAGLSFALTMAPWWVRNFLQFGRFVPFTTAGGLMFLGPLSESAIFSAGRPPSGEAIQAAWTMRKALHSIAAEPFLYAGRVVLHAGRAVLLDVGQAEQFFWFMPVRWPGLIVALMTACQTSWCILWAMAANGFRRVSAMHLVLLASVAVQFAAINMWLQFYERHRLILMPMLILMAVRALVAAELPDSAAQND